MKFKGQWDASRNESKRRRRRQRSRLTDLILNPIHDPLLVLNPISFDELQSLDSDVKQVVPSKLSLGGPFLEDVGDFKVGEGELMSQDRVDFGEDGEVALLDSIVNHLD